MPRSFDLKFKLEVLEYANQHSGEAAARKFGVTPSTIRGWKRNKSKIVSIARENGTNRKRLKGAGCKFISEEMENDILSWVLDRKRNQQAVSRRLIRKLAKEIFPSYIDSRKTNFKASNGWLTRFMRRHNLSLRPESKPRQSDPENLNKKLAMFITFVAQQRLKYQIKPEDIVAADEMSFWFDMPGPQDLGASGNEKIYFTVLLAAKGDGSKMEPYIVLKKSNCELKSMQTASGVVTASSINGWFDDYLTVDWLNLVFNKEQASKRMLVWDAYKCHISRSTKERLSECNSVAAVIPAGLSKYIQPSDVVWTKQFKTVLTECYIEWMAEDKIEECENHVLIAEWVRKAWDELSPAFIENSFKVCGLTVDGDGSEDCLIKSLASGEPCCGARELLQSYRGHMSEVIELVDEEDFEETEENEMIIDLSDKDCSDTNSETEDDEDKME